MFMPKNPHTTAVLQALFVTFLWSTSFVLIKIGLRDIPAVTFAGLRYFLAFLVLLPLFLFSGRASRLRHLTRRDWLALIILGVLYYAVTQGTQFVALAYLPAVNLSLLLNGTAVVVALLSIPLLQEVPSPRQAGGIGLFFTGVVLFFFPFALPEGQFIGYAVATIHLLATSFSSILGRAVNRQQRLDPLTVTTVSMGAGGALLLATGLAAEPAPHLDAANWAIIAILAVVNTAFAFTLWNKTLRTLTATESVMINNTMLIQIAVLAWIFLDETVTLQQIGGMIVAASGALLVQLGARQTSNEAQQQIAAGE